MPSRVYTKEQADAILARAIEMQRGDSTSHDDLVAAAREVGVPPEAIELAAHEVLAKARDEDDVRALRARAWRGFLAHLVPYVMVNALLAFINVLTGSFPWVILVMLAWGVGLASHLLAVVMPDREGLLRRVERQRERALRRANAIEEATAAAGGGARVRVPDELRVGAAVAHVPTAAGIARALGAADAPRPPRATDGAVRDAAPGAAPGGDEADDADEAAGDDSARRHAR
jgi:hypothetical protein